MWDYTWTRQNCKSFFCHHTQMVLTRGSQPFGTLDPQIIILLLCVPPKQDSRALCVPPLVFSVIKIRDWNWPFWGDFKFCIPPVTCSRTPGGTRTPGWESLVLTTPECVAVNKIKHFNNFKRFRSSRPKRQEGVERTERIKSRLNN